MLYSRAIQNPQCAHVQKAQSPQQAILSTRDVNTDSPPSSNTYCVHLRFNLHKAYATMGRPLESNMVLINIGSLNDAHAIIVCQFF